MCHSERSVSGVEPVGRYAVTESCLSLDFSSEIPTSLCSVALRLRLSSTNAQDDSGRESLCCPLTAGFSHSPCRGAGLSLSNKIKTIPPSPLRATPPLCSKEALYGRLILAGGDKPPPLRLCPIFHSSLFTLHLSFSLREGTSRLPYKCNEIHFVGEIFA